MRIVLTAVLALSGAMLIAVQAEARRAPPQVRIAKYTKPVPTKPRLHQTIRTDTRVAGGHRGAMSAL